MDDFDLEQQAIQARRQRAAALRGSQMPDGRMVGNVYVRPSFAQYLATGLKQYAGAKDEQSADAEMRDLSTKRQQEMANALRGFSERMQDKPGQSAPGTEEDPGYTIPGQKADPMAAYGQLLQSPMADMRKMGMQGMLQMPEIQARQKEREEDRTFRATEAALARKAKEDAAVLANQQRMEQMQQTHQLRMDMMAAQNASREQMAQAQREFQQQQAEAQRLFQREMRSFAAGSRAPEPLEQVIGPDGKPVLVKRSDAVGKTPYSPSKSQGPMSATMQKELLESDDTVQSANNVVRTLEAAKKINNNAYSGYFAKGRATLASNIIPGATPGADATIDIDNMMTGQGLEQMKSIFGAAPTEGERKILLEMQASADKTPKQREAIMDRAIAAAKRRAEYASSKAKSIRDGSYLSQGIPAAPADAAAPAPMSPEDTQAREWALKNKDDPRAKQILQRLGG